MKKAYLILSIFLGFSATAFGAESTLSQDFIGTFKQYSEHDRRFVVRQVGTILGIEDKTNGIRYRFDLANKGEQPFPGKYYDYLKKKSVELNGLVKGFSVSNLVVYGNGEKLAGTISFDLLYENIFSDMNAKIAFDFDIESIEKGKGCAEIYNGAIGQYEEPKCLKAKNYNWRVTEISTGFGSSASNIIGFVLSFNLKLLSSIIGGEYGTFGSELHKIKQ